MRSLLAAVLPLAGGCSDRTDPANNAQADSSPSNLSDSRNEAAVRRPAALEGLRSICFGFDLGSMTEATLSDMIRSVDRMTAAYRRLGVGLSHRTYLDTQIGHGSGL